MIVFFLISWAACLSGLDYSCRRTERQEKGGRASLALACLLGGRSPVCKGNMGKKVARPSTELVQTEGRAKGIFFGAECWQHQRAAGTASDRVQVACTE